MVLPATKGEAYPFSIPLVQKGFDLRFTTPVTFICGENGSGKSTLIESVALHCAFSSTGGSRNHNLGGQSLDVAPLQELLKFSWNVKVNTGFFVRAESFFQFSNFIDELARETGVDIYQSYGGASLHAQSHGEAFLSLFSHQLSRRGIFILDEPEAALSPQRQLALLRIVHELVKTGNAQFIIATHSPLLMAYPDASLFFINQGEISERGLTTTPHFQVLARFFANPVSYVSEVLAD
ncbi:AAA family ATPase [Bradyrhizobium sp. UFLA01-814]|uniref:AAA family ATPase n=1 Tax=Bradyrhizobium sp. UFLA01-814 TaxID=3023480 RepID=UPI00398A89B3